MFQQRALPRSALLSLILSIRSYQREELASPLTKDRTGGKSLYELRAQIIEVYL
jgi:hypothetical protein